MHACLHTYIHVFVRVCVCVQQFQAYYQVNQ